MVNINVSRVILGGLVAGLVMNVTGFIYQLVFADQMAETLVGLGLEEPGVQAMIVFNLLGFVGGIVLLWVYAAIRPRFGAGAGTAIMAAIALWIVGSLIPSVAFAVLGLFSARAMTVGTIFDVIVFCISAIAGAWVYREGPATPG